MLSEDEEYFFLNQLPCMTLSEIDLFIQSGTWRAAVPPVILVSGESGRSARPELPSILLSYAPNSSAADLIATPDTLADIVQRVTAQPLAALALVQHLRASEGIAIPQALIAESFAYATLQAGPEFAQWHAGLRQKAPSRERGSHLLYADHGRYHHIRLNCPARANMINMALRSDLTDLLSSLALSDSDQPILLTGEGRWFCAGGDVNEFGQAPSAIDAHQLRMRVPLPAAMARLAHRLHVHLHGAVIGAGLELAAFARHISADPQTTFKLPEVSMGLLPGCGGTVSLPRRIGRQQLALMCLADLTISAQTALEWGMIDEISEHPPRL